MSYAIVYYLLPVLGLLAIAIVMIVAGSVQALLDEKPLLTFGAYFLLLPILIHFALMRRYRGSAIGMQDCTISFENNLIRTQMPNAVTELQWNAIQSFAEDKRVFLLYLAPARFIIVPKRACSIEQINELHSMMHGRVHPGVR